jgi:hypothetical protein
MAFVKFRYITRDRDRHGTVRFYFRRPGKPKIRLRGLPGSEEFLAAYKAALGEKLERRIALLSGRPPVRIVYINSSKGL